MNQVHVCLLSGQLLPNLIPVLMERPSRVYLAVSREMQQSGRDKRMKRILRKEGIEVRLRPRAPSTGFEAIRDFATKLANELISAESGNLIVLNATGGTKLLSMGFVEIFRASLEGYPLRVIYTDTEHRMIETLVPRGQAPVPMRGVLDADSYLAAQGMNLISAASDRNQWRKDTQIRASLTTFLAENCAQLGGFFGTINGMVHGETAVLSANGEQLICAGQQFRNKPQGLWRRALTHIADMGLVNWDGAQSIRFESVGAAHYLGGRWLEEYAWLSAQAARLQDARCAAEGRWESHDGPDAPTNEFDLLAVHDNRILIIECKTGTKGASEQAVATRLESLKRNAGGLFGASLLVSARGLASSMKRRCESLGIAIIEQGSITKLQSRLEAWRDNANS